MLFGKTSQSFSESIAKCWCVSFCTSESVACGDDCMLVLAAASTILVAKKLHCHQCHLLLVMHCCPNFPLQNVSHYYQLLVMLPPLVVLTCVFLCSTASEALTKSSPASPSKCTPTAAAAGGCLGARTCTSSLVSFT
jgi:hypothetical protein